MSTRYYAATLALGLAASLLLGEILIRTVAPQNLSGTWRIYSDRGYMLNRKGGRARHQFGDRVVWYRFNDHHLRGGPLRSEGKRVLVLGDSFTFGWLLNEEDTFVHLLQQYADQYFGPGAFEIVNGAVAGWGTSDCLAYLLDEGEALTPAVVLSILNCDDIGRQSASLFTLQQEGPLRLIRNPPAVNPPLLKMWFRQLPICQWILEHSHLVQLVRSEVFDLQYPEFSDPVRPQPRSARRTRSEEVLLPVPASYANAETLRLAPIRGRALFREMNRWCRDHDARLLVSTLGWRGLQNDPTTVFTEQAAQILKEEQIAFHDLSPEMTAITAGQLASVSIPGDLHPDEQAHRFMAQFIWVWLKEQLEALFPDIPPLTHTQ